MKPLYKNTLLFLLLVGLFFAFSSLNKKYLLTDELLKDDFSKKYSIERVEDILKTQTNIHWYSYLINPTILFVKLHIYTITILSAFVFFEIKTKYADILLIVTTAYFSFLLTFILKFINFGFFTELNSLQQYKNYIPYSLLFYTKEIPNWLRYPVFLINVSEIAFISIMIFSFKRKFNLKLIKSSVIVISSYGLLTLLVAVVVVFLNIMSA